jgi:hypothetical protein
MIHPSPTTVLAMAMVALAGWPTSVSALPSSFNCDEWTAGDALPSGMGSPTYNTAPSDECTISGLPVDYTAGQTYRITISSAVDDGLGLVGFPFC